MKQEELFRWVKAIGISVVIFTLSALYLYLPSKRFDLFYANKSLAHTATILAGITLLIGPLSKSQRFMTSLMVIRRHLGLAAFGVAMLHFVISLFFLPERFPLKWFLQDELIPFILGLIALGIWIYLTYISRNSKIISMGSDLWKKHQQWGGRVAFILVFLHIAVMKWPMWMEWWSGKLGERIPAYKNPYYIPANFVVTALMVLIIVYRVVIYLRHKKD